MAHDRLTSQFQNLATCFFLGMLFLSFPYDYYILWARPTATSAPPSLPFLNDAFDPSNATASREPYYALLETHLRFLHNAPPLISRILHIVMGMGGTGLILKLYKADQDNLLFDGASLVLYVCGIIVYVNNIVKGLRIVTIGLYDAAKDSPELLAETGDAAVPKEEFVNREDSLRVLAASNTILALVLVGVLVLQAGQWYAQKRESDELDEMDKAALEKKTAKEKGGSGKQRSPAGEERNTASSSGEGKKKQ
ncbi:MAG: hypothetical protein M1831_003847 [Alyxoria varia]|nr:MAG: hypothetical protein M1831_003847 [Alyxoria varia]